MRKHALGLCAMLLACMLGPSKPLSAGTLALTFQGASSYLGSYYVAPYQVSVSGTTYNLICDDANDNVTVGEQWNATTETLASSSTIQGALFSGAPGQSVSQLQAYEEAGYLAYEINNTTGATSGEYQYALWDLFDPGFSNTSGTLPNGEPGADLTAAEQQAVNGYLAAAEQASNYASATALAYDANLVIYTPTPKGPGEPQEYIGVGTPQAMPEPMTLWSLLMVLAAIGLACKWMDKTTVKSSASAAV
jgi:hypothetical protein